MFTNPAPLAATVDELRTGQHSLSLYIEQQCLRIDRVELHVAALLPEPERKARLLADGRALTAAYPRPGAWFQRRSGTASGRLADAGQ